MEDYRLTQSGQEVQDVLNGAAMQVDLTAETERATEAEHTLQGNIDEEEIRAKAAEKQNADDIDAEELARQQADQTLDGKISDEEIRAKAAEKQNADDIDALEAAIQAILLLIPSAATSLNKLTDKSYVDSSIATATATFRGTYNLVSDLNLMVSATHAQIATALAGAVSDEDNNDYAFVQIPTSDATPTQIAKTERYKFNGTAWEYEYDLNNSGYTADQWAAINSGITQALVTKLSALPTNADLTTALGVLTDGIAAINAKIPSAASSSNKLVDSAAMVAYIGQIIDAIDATFNVTSTDGHVTVQITQVNGVITAVNVTTSDIASAADLSLVAGRVTTAEGNISTNAQDIAQLQAAYGALTQSAPQVIEPTDTWPVANPSTTVIYRVVDRVNTPPQYYSDYMYNGTTMVQMAQYNNAIDPRPKKGSQNLVTSGGVFDNMGALDVSELNATENPHTLAIYADLSAALAAISSDYQKGGMSIKFVEGSVGGSDNKYVQFRLMNNQWSTTESDWQGIDDAPTVGSDNLVKSGGVVKYLNGLGYICKTVKEVSYVTTDLNRYIFTISENIGKSLVIKLKNNSGQPILLYYKYGTSEVNDSFANDYDGTYEINVSNDITQIVLAFANGVSVNGAIDIEITSSILKGIYNNSKSIEDNTSDITKLDEVVFDKNSYGYSDFVSGRYRSVDIGEQVGSMLSGEGIYRTKVIPVKKSDNIALLYKGYYMITDSNSIVYGKENLNQNIHKISLVASCDGFIYINLFNASASDNISVTKQSEKKTSTTRAFDVDYLTIGWYFEYNSVGQTANFKPRTDSYVGRTFGVMLTYVHKGDIVKGHFYGKIFYCDKDLLIYQADSSSNVSQPYKNTVSNDGFIFVNYDRPSVNTGFELSIASKLEDIINENENKSCSYNNYPLPVWKNGIKILAIGNSFTEDSTQYLSDIATASGSDLLEFALYRLIVGGAEFSEWCTLIDANSTPQQLNRILGGVNMNIGSNNTIQEILAKDWDVVIIQQYSLKSTMYMAFQPYLTNIINRIRTYCVNNRVCIGYNMPWSNWSGTGEYAATPNLMALYLRPHDENRWQAICDATQEMVYKSGIDFILPVGTAMQNARHTSLQTNHQITRDGLHASFGVGRYVCACVWYQMLIAPFSGITILGNMATHEVTQYEREHAEALYELVDVTASNNGLCQRCAFNACIDMYNISYIEES